MAKKKPEALRELHHEDGRIEVQYSDGSNEFFFRSLEQELQFTIKKLENFLQELQKNPNNALLNEYIKAYLLKVREFEADSTIANKTILKELLDKSLYEFH